MTRKDLDLLQQAISPMRAVHLFDYQIAELEEIRKQNDGLLNTTDVIGHLIEVYKVTRGFYDTWLAEEHKRERVS